MDKENVIHRHPEYYAAVKKERNPVICNNIDETGGHYAERSKSDTGEFCILYFYRIWKFLYGIWGWGGRILLMLPRESCRPSPGP